MSDWRETSKYDSAAWRQSVRAGRQKGVTVFIPAAELRKAGINPDALPPIFRLTGMQSRKSSHRVIVNLRPVDTCADGTGVQ